MTAQHLMFETTLACNGKTKTAQHMYSSSSSLITGTVRSLIFHSSLQKLEVVCQSCHIPYISKQFKPMLLSILWQQYNTKLQLHSLYVN